MYNKRKYLKSTSNTKEQYELLYSGESFMTCTTIIFNNFGLRIKDL